MANQTRIKYKNQGTCSWCPRPRHVTTDHTYVLCYAHLTQSRVNQAKRMNRPQIGLCRRCRDYAEPGRTLCEYHLEYERKRLINNNTHVDNSKFII